MEQEQVLAGELTASPSESASAIVLGVAVSESDVSPHENFYELALVGRELPLDRHPAAVYLASLSPGSRRSMRIALNLVAATLTSGRCDAFSLDWSRLRYGHTAAVRAVLAERYAPATVNQALAALKGVLKAAWRLEMIDDRDYARAVDVPGVKNHVPPRGRAAAVGELRALFSICCDGTPLGARDAALLALAYGCGLRRAELVALERRDLEPETGELLVRRGKGNKARVVYVAGGAGEAAQAWLHLRGDAEGPLLWPVLKGGRLVPRRLSPQTVRDVLEKRAMQAGLKSLSPHDLRRSFISDLLEAGADISTVQKLAGHANVSTTTRYDRRGEAAKKKATGLLHVPFTRG
jgi:integrase/recombinase XerD